MDVSTKSNTQRPTPVRRSRRGAALMLALFATTLLMVIATEIMYETNVEYVVSTQAVHRVRAYWSARAAVEISLLRISIFRQAKSLAGQNLPDPSLLDQIWQQPFAWPPPLPDGVGEVERSEIQKAVKASDLTAIRTSYLATIESEGARIDVNDLGSPSTILAKATKDQLLGIFRAKLENDEAFASRYRGRNFEELIDNIKDYIDPDETSSAGGGPEATALLPDGNPIPTKNEPLESLSELHFVSGMSDEIYDLLEPRLTLYGSKGININQASADVLKALGPDFTEDRVAKIIEHRQDPKRGPFKDEKAFVEFLNSLGISGNPFREGEAAKVSLIFEPETNFRIRATGISGKSQREITAIVWDEQAVRSRLENMLPAAPTPVATAAAPTPTPAPGSAAPTPQPSPRTSPTPSTPSLGRPKIVYWNEQ
ncbi:MAG TPA: type II secretion system protein GspK [Pseudobdellovibrionaceae bacterium]|nr:type II secretion system protein GspK [Pseudobdellovibrionaceae bacterium]